MAVVVACALAACAGGDDGVVGSEDQAIVPCNSGRPAFDVWRADFAPNGRQRITATVDTLDASTAAEFRLVLACQGEVVAEAIGGLACREPPPKRAGANGSPECPLIEVAVADIDFDSRIECLAEVTTTEPLDIGSGACADAARADYRILMTIDSSPLALDLVADDCRDDESCLQSMFGIE